MEHKVTTYFPATYTERNSLSDEWRRAEAIRRAEAVARAEQLTEQQPQTKTNSIGWTTHSRKVEPAQPTVAELLEQQKAMAYEAGVVERMRQQAEREHIRLLGRTPDIAGGRMDTLLRRAREISTRNPAAVETEVPHLGAAPPITSDGDLCNIQQVESQLVSPRDEATTASMTVTPGSPGSPGSADIRGPSLLAALEHVESSAPHNQHRHRDVSFATA